MHIFHGTHKVLRARQGFSNAKRRPIGYPWADRPIIMSRPHHKSPSLRGHKSPQTQLPTPLMRIYRFVALIGRSTCARKRMQLGAGGLLNLLLHHHRLRERARLASTTRRRAIRLGTVANLFRVCILCVCVMNALLMFYTRTHCTTNAR